MAVATKAQPQHSPNNLPTDKLLTEARGDHAVAAFPVHVVHLSATGDRAPGCKHEVCLIKNRRFAAVLWS